MEDQQVKYFKALTSKASIAWEINCHQGDQQVKQSGISYAREIA